MKSVVDGSRKKAPIYKGSEVFEQLNMNLQTFKKII